VTGMQAVTGMQLSLALKSYEQEDPGSWGYLLSRARVLDRTGVDRVLVSDHVVFGEELEEYARPEIGGQAGGTQPTGPDGCWLEPLTLLSVIAGQTSRIRLCTNILLAALRTPAVLAKQAATLDVLSQGRLDMGVGVGWQKAEYDAAGLPFAGRGRLLEHSLDVCQLLWTRQRASYSSQELTFDNIHSMPKPAQPGGVPIWVSGTVNKRVVARLARYGCRWIPWGPSAAGLSESIRRLRDELAAAGADPGALRVFGNLPVHRSADGSVDVSRTMAAVPELAGIGVTEVTARFPLPDDDEAAEEQLVPLVQAFREAAGRAG
jgi:probable F420-dependent oxidoreductase